MEKISKEAAQYTPIAKAEDHCRDCRHFIVPHSCERVLGAIAVGGWCKLWAEKHSLAKVKR